MSSLQVPAASIAVAKKTPHSVPPDLDKSTFKELSLRKSHIQFDHLAHCKCSSHQWDCERPNNPHHHAPCSCSLLTIDATRTLWLAINSLAAFIELADSSGRWKHLQAAAGSSPLTLPVTSTDASAAWSSAGTPFVLRPWLRQLYKRTLRFIWHHRQVSSLKSRLETRRLVPLLKCVGWEWQISGIHPLLHSSCSQMVKDQDLGSSPPLLLQTNQSTPHAPNDIGSNQWNPNGAKVQSLGDAGCNKPLLASNWFHQDGQDGPLSTYWAYLAYGVWLGATRTPYFKSCNIHVSIVRYQGPGHQPLQGLRVDSLSARTISLYLIIHYQPASQTLPVEVEGTCQLCSQLESHCLLYWWGDMSEKHCGQLRSAR